ncbi:MAG: YbaK/EbsC family protein [Nanoarchaeota archaeon]
MSETSFEDLSTLLVSKGIAFKVLEHKPVFTMEDVVRELDIPRQSMAKVLLVSIIGKGLYRVVLPGMSRLNLQRLASVLGVSRRNIQFAEKEVVEQAGFTVGAISPFGGQVSTCIDQSLLDQEVLYCGAGDNDKTFSLKPADIVSLSSALVANIAD